MGVASAVAVEPWCLFSEEHAFDYFQRYEPALVPASKMFYNIISPVALLSGSDEQASGKTSLSKVAATLQRA
jgi:hypothetical protein